MARRVLAALALLIAVAHCQNVSLGVGVQVQAGIPVDVRYEGGHVAHYDLQHSSSVLLANVHVFPLLRRYPVEYMLVGFSHINAQGLPQVGYDLTFTQPTTPIDVYVSPPPLIPTWIHYMASHPDLTLFACFTHSVQNWYATFPLRDYNATAGTVAIQMPYEGAYVVLAGPPTAPQYALYDYPFETPKGAPMQIKLPAGVSLQWSAQKEHRVVLRLSSKTERLQQTAQGCVAYRFITAEMLDEAVEEGGEEGEEEMTVVVTWTYDANDVAESGLDLATLALYHYNTTSGVWESLPTTRDATAPSLSATLRLSMPSSEGGKAPMAELSVQAHPAVSSNTASSAPSAKMTHSSSGIVTVIMTAVVGMVAARHVGM